MGVTGAVVWCRAGDRWVPLRLDAIKLPGTLTKAHWESVVQLINLASKQQLYLQDVSVVTKQERTAAPSVVCSQSDVKDNCDSNVVTVSAEEAKERPPQEPTEKENNNSGGLWQGLSNLSPRIQEKRLQRLREAWARNTRKLSTGSSTYCVFSSQE